MESFDDIMRGITRKLTGDSKQDIKYLRDQMDKYKDHELSTEILRACGRLVAECLPEEARTKLENFWDNDQKGIDAALEEIRFLMYKKDMKKAEELSDSMVQKADGLKMYQSDSLSDYYIFGETFEELLFHQYHKDGKKVRSSGFPFSKIYFLNGNIKLELKKYEEALCSLRKAAKWSPANCRIAFEYSEALKLTGDLEGYIAVTSEAFRYAFCRKDVARCYRNWGYYFVEKEKYNVAIACYQISMHFDESRAASSELYYIQSVTGKKIEDFSTEKIKSICKENHIPSGIQEEVLAVAYEYGQYFLKNQQINGAIYCFSIFAELTQDPEMFQIVEQLKEMKDAKQN